MTFCTKQTFTVVTVSGVLNASVLDPFLMEVLAPARMESVIEKV